MMSCVIDDVRALSPVLEVAELSQICEGLARQRPDNIQTLLHAMALIAPLLNAIPNVVFIKDVQARYLMVNMTPHVAAGLRLWSPAGQNLCRCFPFGAWAGLYRAGYAGAARRGNAARSAGNAFLQRS